MEQLNLPAVLHTVTMEERRKLRISGVSDVDSFDENSVTVFTSMGDINILGENLHIIKIDVEKGELFLEGTIYSIAYVDRPDKSENFLSKLFK